MKNDKRVESARLERETPLQAPSQASSTQKNTPRLEKRQEKSQATKTSGKLRMAVQIILEQNKEIIREYPGAAIGIAFVTGVLLSVLVM